MLKTRSVVPAVVLAALGTLAAGVLPLACQTGGIGDPCTPEQEFNPDFPGFKVSQDFIESRSFQCQTRICLVNHFQGRVSCPMGQAAPAACSKDGDCGSGKCVVSVVDAPSCESKDDCGSYDGGCNSEGKFCGCKAACPKEGFVCEGGQCKKKVCFSGECQTEADENPTDKACCIPGSTTPIAQPVCGQCGPNTKRSADNAVYCSCRCGPPDGAENDPVNLNANFCECPEGFTCTQIRADIGLGDKLLAGKYCIRDGSEFKSDSECRGVKGHLESGCEGP